MSQTVVRPTVFVSSPSQHLKCGFCHKVYNDPVISTVCGHTFCRSCITSCKPAEVDDSCQNGNSVVCPLDSFICGLDTLVLNRAVVGQIDDLLIHCQYGVKLTDAGEYVMDENGCPEKVSFGLRQQHEDDCSYGAVVCPNSAECGTFKKSNLSAHLEICTNFFCSAKNAGCRFSGRHTDLLEHYKECSFYLANRLVQGSDGANDTTVLAIKEQIGNLTTENQHLSLTVDQLTNRVKKLEGERDEMRKQLISCKTNITKLTQTVEELQHSMESKGRTSSGLNCVMPKSPRSTSTSMMSTSSPVSNPNVSLVDTSTSSRSNSTENWTTPLMFKCLGTFRGHKGPVYALANRGSRIFSAGGDKVIKVWNVDMLAKGCIHTIVAHNDGIFCIALMRNVMFSAGADYSIKAWDVNSYEQKAIREQAHNNIICALVHCGEYIFTSSYSVIKVWSAKDLEPIHTIDGLYHWVRALAVNRTKDKVYSGSHNTIEMWDASGKFNLRGKIDHKYGSIHSLVLTSKYIIAGTYNQNIRLFNISTHQHVIHLRGHVGAVTSLLVSPSERFLFSGSADNSVQIMHL
ncbi:E3 ubiquitin-protein ligase TRAF7-like isoform X2 [Tubulanus polymorphus]|uniref:E3 ubiquitin-protein ligase TRAF7-like isoform X2 n=1 Tax=Tubulanus polymorphus TaxID=672921 RepID=UPI003DA461E5